MYFNSSQRCIAVTCIGHNKEGGDDHYGHSSDSGGSGHGDAGGHGGHHNIFKAGSVLKPFNVGLQYT